MEKQPIERIEDLETLVCHLSHTATINEALEAMEKSKPKDTPKEKEYGGKR